MQRSAGLCFVGKSQNSCNRLRFFLRCLFAPRNSWWQGRLAKTFEEALDDLERQMLQLGQLGECLETVRSISEIFLECMGRRGLLSSSAGKGCLKGKKLPNVTLWPQLRLCGSQGTADINAMHHVQIALGKARISQFLSSPFGYTMPGWAPQS